MWPCASCFLNIWSLEWIYFLCSVYGRSRWSVKRRWSQKRERSSTLGGGKTALMKMMMTKRMSAAVAAPAAATKMRSWYAGRRNRRLPTRTRTWKMRRRWWTVCLRTPSLCWSLPALHRESCCCWCSNSIWKIFMASQTGELHKLQRH